MTRLEVVERLWDQSERHRGKRLALWVKDGDSRKERAKRAEAVELFAHRHAVKSQGEYRRWKMFHGLRVWMGRWAKRVRKAIRRRKRRHQDGGGGGLGGVDITLSAGAPHWGGSGDVMRQYVEPFMQARGLPLGSGKRTPAYNASIGGSPVSDHLTTKTTTDARDFPTYSGEDDARALAASIGWGSWSSNSYVSHEVVIDGRTFGFQILWGAGIGHGDHVHVGVSLH